MKCPKCGLSDIHICKVLSEEPLEIYKCNTCSEEWDNTNKCEVQDDKTVQKCYWCSNYHSLMSNAQSTSFVLGVPDITVGLKPFEPKFCPVCGNPMPNNSIEVKE